jgi:hypothetical protein
MPLKPTFFVVALLSLLLLLACPIPMLAQHHGGGGHGVGSIPGGAGRPDGVDEKDSLKDFHQAMAVEASSQQVAEFQLLLKNTEAVKTELHSFAKGGSTQEVTRDSRGLKLHDSFENVRVATGKFLESFSAKQKSGLKEATKRLERADAAVEDEGKKFDQTLQAGSTSGNAVTVRAASLDKALTEFSNQQLALGREMGIVLADPNDLTFNLPLVKSTITLASQSLGVAVSGVLFETAVENNQRTFRLEMAENMSELQPIITEVLGAQIDRANSCGEHIAVRQATLRPSTPASVVTLQLHFERWTCLRVGGQTMSNELAESDGEVEIKLVPALEKSGSLTLTSEFSRIDARGMMGDAIRSGDLGPDIRERLTQSLLPVFQVGANFRNTLPQAIQGAATLKSAKFQDLGAGVLGLTLEGQVQISDQQAKVLVDQLNQTLSARRTTVQGTAPR